MLLPVETKPAIGYPEGRGSAETVSSLEDKIHYAKSFGNETFISSYKSSKDYYYYY